MGGVWIDRQFFFDSMSCIGGACQTGGQRRTKSMISSSGTGSTGGVCGSMPNPSTLPYLLRHNLHLCWRNGSRLHSIWLSLCQLFGVEVGTLCGVQDCAERGGRRALAPKGAHVGFATTHPRSICWVLALRNYLAFCSERATGWRHGCFGPSLRFPCHSCLPRYAKLRANFDAKYWAK